MVKLYDTNDSGYLEVEVREFYSNDYPQYFALTGNDSYLRDFAEPFYQITEMIYGSKPTDNGNLLLSPEERDELVAREPAAQKWIRPFMGAREFIHNLPRYCLWLVDCPPNELRKMPLVYRRVQAVKDFRLASKKSATRKDAATPWLFQEIRQPSTDYIMVPSVSSERRRYIPIGYVSANVIASNLVHTIPTASFFTFGVLTSLPHMVWTGMVCGRLESRYRYSADVVYNNFPWPPFWREVERTAAQILAARRNYPDATLADLYDPLIMPKDLRKAHEANDRAVMAAYDFPKNITEDEMRVAFLEMYDRLSNFDKIFNGE